MVVCNPWLSWFVEATLQPLPLSSHSLHPYVSVSLQPNFPFLLRMPDTGLWGTQIQVTASLASAKNPVALLGRLPRLQGLGLEHTISWGTQFNARHGEPGGHCSQVQPVCGATGRSELRAEGSPDGYGDSRTRPSSRSRVALGKCFVTWEYYSVYV